MGLGLEGGGKREGREREQNCHPLRKQLTTLFLPRVDNVCSPFSDYFSPCVCYTVCTAAAGKTIRETTTTSSSPFSFHPGPARKTSSVLPQSQCCTMWSCPHCLSLSPPPEWGTWGERKKEGTNERERNFQQPAATQFSKDFFLSFPLLREGRYKRPRPPVWVKARRPFQRTP